MNLNKAVILTIAIGIVVSVNTVSGSAGSQIPEKGLLGEITIRLRNEIPKLLEKYKIPGCAVALTDGDGVVWSQTYGYTDGSRKYPITDGTFFAIMSNSKSFVALGVLLAVQDGLLDLDKPIAYYLPDFRANSVFSKDPAREITLRHLLTHRSGLENDIFTEELNLRHHEIAEYVKYIKDSWMNFPVGYRSYYSNIGVELAAYIVEKKTGVRFGDYIEKRIFKPLAMSETTYDLQKVEGIAERAIGHWAREADRDKRPPFYQQAVACGGIYSNIRDMGKYLRFYLNKGTVKEKQLLRSDLLQEMYTLAYPEEGQKAGYSIGMEISPVPESFYLYQDGGGYGFQSKVLIYPDYGFAVVILTNSCWTQVTNKVDRMVKEAVCSNYGEKEAEKEMLPVVGLEKLSGDDPALKKVFGVYDIENKLYSRDGKCFLDLDEDTYPVDFYLKNGKLLGRTGSFSEIAFLPDLPGGPGNMILTNLKSGTVDYYSYNKPLPENDSPGSAKLDWKSHLGDYQILFAGTVRGQFSITIENGYLTLGGLRCREYLPGLFFTPDGNALDFRNGEKRLAGFPLIKIVSSDNKKSPPDSRTTGWCS